MSTAAITPRVFSSASEVRVAAPEWYADWSDAEIRDVFSEHGLWADASPTPELDGPRTPRVFSSVDEVRAAAPEWYADWSDAEIEGAFAEHGLWAGPRSTVDDPLAVQQYGQTPMPREDAEPDQHWLAQLGGEPPLEQGPGFLPEHEPAARMLIEPEWAAAASGAPSALPAEMRAGMQTPGWLDMLGGLLGGGEGQPALPPQVAQPAPTVPPYGMAGAPPESQLDAWARVIPGAGQEAMRLGAGALDTAAGIPRALGDASSALTGQLPLPEWLSDAQLPLPPWLSDEALAGGLQRSARDLLGMMPAVGNTADPLLPPGTPETAGAYARHAVQNPADTFSWGLRQLLRSAPHMALSHPTLLPGLAAGLGGSIGRERGEGEGRDDPTQADLAAGLAAGIPSAYLQQLGTSTLLKGLGGADAAAPKGLARDFAERVLTEAGTETAQSGIEHLGRKAFTESGIDPTQMGAEMMQGLIGGTAGGAGMGGPAVLARGTRELMGDPEPLFEDRSRPAPDATEAYLDEVAGEVDQQRSVVDTLMEEEAAGRAEAARASAEAEHARADAMRTEAEAARRRADAERQQGAQRPGFWSRMFGAGQQPAPTPAPTAAPPTSAPPPGVAASALGPSPAPAAAADPDFDPGMEEEYYGPDDPFTPPGQTGPTGGQIAQQEPAGPITGDELAQGGRFAGMMGSAEEDALGQMYSKEVDDPNLGYTEADAAPDSPYPVMSEPDGPAPIGEGWWNAAVKEVKSRPEIEEDLRKRSVDNMLGLEPSPLDTPEGAGAAPRRGPTLRVVDDRGRVRDTSELLGDIERLNEQVPQDNAEMVAQAEAARFSPEGQRYLANSAVQFPVYSAQAEIDRDMTAPSEHDRSLGRGPDDSRVVLWVSPDVGTAASYAEVESEDHDYPRAGLTTEPATAQRKSPRRVTGYLVDTPELLVFGRGKGMFAGGEGRDWMAAFSPADGGEVLGTNSATVQAVKAELRRTVPHTVKQRIRHVHEFFAEPGNFAIPGIDPRMDDARTPGQTFARLRDIEAQLEAYVVPEGDKALAHELKNTKAFVTHARRHIQINRWTYSTDDLVGAVYRTVDGPVALAFDGVFDRDRGRRHMRDTPYEQETEYSHAGGTSMAIVRPQGAVKSIYARDMATATPAQRRDTLHSEEAQPPLAYREGDVPAPAQQGQPRPQPAPAAPPSEGQAPAAPPSEGQASWPRSAPTRERAQRALTKLRTYDENADLLYDRGTWKVRWSDEAKPEVEHNTALRVMRKALRNYPRIAVGSDEATRARLRESFTEVVSEEPGKVVARVMTGDRIHHEAVRDRETRTYDSLLEAAMHGELAYQSYLNNTYDPGSGAEQWITEGQGPSARHYQHRVGGNQDSLANSKTVYVMGMHSRTMPRPFGRKGRKTEEQQAHAVSDIFIADPRSYVVHDPETALWSWRDGEGEMETIVAPDIVGLSRRVQNRIASQVAASGTRLTEDQARSAIAARGYTLGSRDEAGRADPVLTAQDQTAGTTLIGPDARTLLYRIEKHEARRQQAAPDAGASMRARGAAATERVRAEQHDQRQAAARDPELRDALASLDPIAQAPRGPGVHEQQPADDSLGTGWRPADADPQPKAHDDPTALPPVDPQDPDATPPHPIEPRRKRRVRGEDLEKTLDDLRPARPGVNYIPYSEHWEAPADTKERAPGERIQPAKRRERILAKLFRRLRIGRYERGIYKSGIRGTAKLFNGEVRTGRVNDLEAAVHEIAHIIDARHFGMWEIGNPEDYAGTVEGPYGPGTKETGTQREARRAGYIKVQRGNRWVWVKNFEGEAPLQGPGVQGRVGEQQARGLGEHSEPITYRRLTDQSLDRPWVSDPAMEAELRALSYDETNLPEGFAEFLRVYATQPRYTEAFAPRMHAWMDQFLSDESGNPDAAPLREGIAEIREWFRADPLERMASKEGSERQRWWEGKTAKEIVRTILWRIRFGMTDKFAGIDKLQRAAGGRRAGDVLESVHNLSAVASFTEGALTLGAPSWQWEARPDGARERVIQFGQFSDADLYAVEGQGTLLDALSNQAERLDEARRAETRVRRAKNADPEKLERVRAWVDREQEKMAKLREMQDQRRARKEQPSLNQIIERFREPGDLDQFLLYVKARSAHELMAQGREQLYTKGEIQAGLALGNKRSDFRESAAQLQDWFNSLVEFGVQSGVVSQHQREAWRRSFYIPFYRVHEGDVAKEQTDQTMVTPGGEIQALEGGSLNTQSTLDAIASHAQRLIGASLKNEAHRQVIDLALGQRGADRWATPVKPQEIAQQVKVSKDSLKEHLREQLVPGQQVEDTGPLPASQMTRKLDQAVNTAIDLWAEAQPETIDLEATSRDPEQFKDRAVVSVKRGGKTHYYEVADRLLFDSLAAMTPKSRNQTMHWLNAGRRAVQNTITISFNFVTGNITRDTLHAGVTSRNGFRPVVDTIRGMRSALRKDQDYWDYIRSGADVGGTGLDEEQMRRRIEKYYSDKGIDPRSVLTTGRKALDAFDQFNWAMERATRLGEFMRARERGESLVSAGFAARDVGNYSQRGAWAAMNFFRDTVPFLSAGWVGLDKGYRALIQKDPTSRAAVWAKVGVLAGAAAAVRALTYDNPLVADAEDWEKDAAFLIPIPTPAYLDALSQGRAKPQSKMTRREALESFTLLRIPKPWEVGSVASVAERTVDAIGRGDFGPIYRQNLMDIVATNFRLEWAPWFVAPFSEVGLGGAGIFGGIKESRESNPFGILPGTNVDPFTGRQHESLSDQALSPAYRGQYAPEVLRQIGFATRGWDKEWQISPARIDALGRSLGNTWWTGTLGTIDWLVFRDKTREKDIGQLPGVKPFFSRRPGRTQAQSDFYDIYIEAMRYAREYDELKERRKLGYAVTRDEIAEARRGSLMAPQLRGVRRRLTRIRKSKEQIRNSRTLTRAQKDQKLDALETREAELMTRFMDKPKAREALERLH